MERIPILRYLVTIDQLRGTSFVSGLPSDLYPTCLPSQKRAATGWAVPLTCLALYGCKGFSGVCHYPSKGVLLKARMWMSMKEGF